MSNATKWLLIAVAIAFVGSLIWNHFGFNDSVIEITNDRTKVLVGPEAKKRIDEAEKMDAIEDAAGEHAEE